MSAPPKPSTELTAEERAKIERLGRLAAALVSATSEQAVRSADLAGLRAMIERHKDAAAAILGACAMAEELKSASQRRAGALNRLKGIAERNTKVKARRAELVAPGIPAHGILGMLAKEFGLSRKQVRRILE